MILATINNTKFALADLKDAEALLNILNRSTQLTEEYKGDWTWRYLTPARSETAITIEINSCALVPSEEHDRIVAEKAQAKAAKALTVVEQAA